MSKVGKKLKIDYVAKYELNYRAKKCAKQLDCSQRKEKERETAEGGTPTKRRYHSLSNGSNGQKLPCHINSLRIFFIKVSYALICHIVKCTRLTKIRAQPSTIFNI